MRKLSFIILWVLGSCLYGQNSYSSLKEKDFMTLPEFNQAINLHGVDIDLIEMGVFHLTNQLRRKNNLPIFTYSEILSDAAFYHSGEMTKNNFFDHYNRYNNELASLDKRTLNVGYTDPKELAENILYSYVSVSGKTTYVELCQRIVTDLYNSKEHRKNMLIKSLEEMGCGISFTKKVKDGFWYFNFTEDFGTRF